MRNFIIATAAALKTGDITELSHLQDGQLAIAKSGGDGVLTALTPAEIGTEKRFQLLYGYTDVEGQKRFKSIPVYNNHFSYTLMGYEAATTFVATITIKNPTVSGEHSVIIAKKGVPFNERNKFTYSVYVKDTNTTSAILANKLKDAINKKPWDELQNEVTATISGSVITLTAKKAGIDYEIKLADGLAENASTVSVTTKGIPAIADTEMVIDLSNKAIADQGINETYQEASELMHPTYPITKGASSLAQWYDIVTMRFAEPREMKTRDDIVHQIVQIAFPRTSESVSSSQYNDFVDILKALEGTYQAPAAAAQSES